MTKLKYTLLLLGTALFTYGQVNYTANDIVQPYDGFFRPSVNLGQYTSFTDESLALLSAGDPNLGVQGVGVKALRPGLFEAFLEQWGYGIRVPAFQYYEELGMTDHTVIVGFPSPQHRDQTQYCPGIQSELFANMYEPIWDGGANGTPVNENNYYALYMWKMVSLYKDHVRFWEIWNEPGFDYTGGLGYLEPGTPGNWWDNNPDPCNYKLRAPIFNYIRLLHISWEVIKTLDPDSYVVVSGTGYPSFLDAILRNTDNPVDGSTSAAYPLKGGAYFDVMGFHSYPHFDGSLREWSTAINDWVYHRHSDAAAEGLLKTKNAYLNVLDKYGYNGNTYPNKLWTVTEINLPRKPFGEYIGSAKAQKNFIIKAITTAMMNGFWQLNIYKLAEDTGYDNANFEFDLMGLYKKLDYKHGLFQEMNDEGIAHKTASDVLFEKTYDPARTAQMNLGTAMGGGAFKDADGNFTYVLWAKTQTDQSETASGTYTFPAGMGISSLLKQEWNSGVTYAAATVSAANLALTGTPVFLTERKFTMSTYNGCTPLMLQLNAQASGASGWTWTLEGPATLTSTLANPLLNLNLPGDYKVTLVAKNAAGQVIAQQTQSLHVWQAPVPQFTQTITGPIVYFQNNSTTGGLSATTASFNWQFGDGQTSTDPVPTHLYLQSGTYTVTLTATNSCGSVSTTSQLTVVSPTTTQLTYTANDLVPVFDGKFRSGASTEFISGWTDEQMADIAAGNPLAGIGNVKGTGVKAFRTNIGESFFIDLGYDEELPLFQHYENLDLRDNTFLLAFPSIQSRDPYEYCPGKQSALFKDLYLDIWDGGANGTPVNDNNPFALYVWNTVNTYKGYVKFWEIFNSPDFDLTGDKGWLPPGEPGNWWENNPDPCDTELGAPIFYYIRSLRIAYEIIKNLDEDAYVTVSGLAYPSFLDAILRNTDNPLNGSVAGPYPLKGGAYFDAVGFKSYPHLDGSTAYFDVNAGGFIYQRHSDAAVDGIARVQGVFKTVLENYGYDGAAHPKKEWTINEANIPRKQFGNYLGSAAAQRNWLIKAWVESVRNGIRQLDFFKLAESMTFSEATDAFQTMGLYKKLDGVTPYNQTLNDEGIALKTCSDMLFGTDFHQAKTNQMALPDGVRGAAFQDAASNFIYVLWAETKTDQSEQASATYTFPGSFGITQLNRRVWDFSQTGQSTVIAPQNIPLTGAPVFLMQAVITATPPVAFFTANETAICAGQTVQFTDFSIGNPTHWEWSFPGGTPAAHFGQTPPAIIYQQAGAFPVSLLVKNSAGEHVATYLHLITVQAQPAAAFSYTINGANVQFTNLSTPPDDGSGSISYQWCYGDGFCNFANQPLYTYFTNGTYTATLTVTNICGESTSQQTITIGAAPTAAFTQNIKGDCENPSFQFIDLSFSNPESWHWVIPGGSPSTSDLRYPIVSFPAAGFYEVTLIAGNGNGADTLTKTVYVEGDIEVTEDVSLCEGDSINGIPVFKDTSFVYNLATLVSGCDSVHTINIIVLPVVRDTIVAEIISGNSFEAGGQTFTQNGKYAITLEAASANGCDSIIYLDLTVLVGTGEAAANLPVFRIFPNPFSERVFIEFELLRPEEVRMEVFDGWGRRVAQVLTNEKLETGNHWFGIETQDFPSGFYWVLASTGKERSFVKMVKI